MKLPKSTWIFLSCAAILVIGMTIIYAHRPGDFAGYLLVGDLGLSGRDIYREAPPGINTWPPFFGMLCMPLAALSRFWADGTRVGWLLLNWIALAVCITLAVRMAYGQRLTLPGITSPTRPGISIAAGAALLPMLLAIRWILSNFEHLQINTILLALILGGLTFHRSRRDLPAGLLLGAAAALKLLAVLFIPYFLWRRQWRAMWFTLAATIGWTLSPILVYGLTGYLDQFSSWMVSISGGFESGKMNNSVFAMLDRILGLHQVPFTVPGTDGVVRSGDPLVTLVFISAVMMVTVLACWLFRGPYDPRRRTTVAEWSIVLLVGAVFSPLSWKYYLVVLLLPMTLFVATWRDPNVKPVFRRRLRWLTWLGFAMGMMAASDLVGRQFAHRLEMGSMMTWMSLLIMGTLFWYRARGSGAGVDHQQLD